MKPTTDIVEELRLYNRWRRGDEAITAPDPTALGKLLDDAADRIEHLFASGIHTCNADCQRPMCVLRRERDKAQNDLARVTAELEHHKSVKETIDSAHKELSREHAALRARSAELEAQIERDAWTLSPEMVQTRNDQLAAKLEQAEQRNAELEAALRDAVGMLEELDGLDWGEEGMPFDVDFNHLAKVLAGTVSATPAKHPDTERLDWLEGAPSERLAEVRRILWQQRNTCEATRAAIDAARALARAESATPSKHPDTERLDWLEQSEAVVTIDRRLPHPVEVATDKTDAVCADSLRAAIDAASNQEGGK